MPQRNAPSPVPTTLRFMASRIRHRLSADQPPAVTARLRERLEPILAPLATAGVAAHWFDVRAGGEWLDTGIDLAPDEPVSIQAEGMVWLARALDVGFGPQVGLWYRVGNAPLRKVLGPIAWLDAGRGGRLSFTTKPPGEFAAVDGAFEPGLTRKPLKGGFTVALLRWPEAPAQALAEAQSRESALFGPLRQEPAERPETPYGWHYLWRLGEGGIFRNDRRHPGRLCCQTHADVGILQFPVDHPLTADTRIDWRWCVQELPSRFPEHTAPTHDYLSIAVEFDNGLDLTWMWSVGLPVDTIFQCPLPWWDQRETHWVVRSGAQQLGQWLDESRPVLADYRQAIGGVEPQRIVGVWLIANTAFQRGKGRCDYEGIRLQTGDRHTAVG